MREIVLDTETTGLYADKGDRIVEIGALELINHMPTGRVFHRYINPQRDISYGAFAIHGLSREFLEKYPAFEEIAAEFLEFLAIVKIIIHNAPFDMAFLNMEFLLAGYAVLAKDRVVDTLVMAKRHFPGAQASLDALCRRFQIDNSHRNLHGALVDADLLASVYLEFVGGRQPGLDLAQPARIIRDHPVTVTMPRPRRGAFKATPEERAVHERFLNEKIRDPVWRWS